MEAPLGHAFCGGASALGLPLRLLYGCHTVRLHLQRLAAGCEGVLAVNLGQALHASLSISAAVCILCLVTIWVQPQHVIYLRQVANMPVRACSRRVDWRIWPVVPADDVRCWKRAVQHLRHAPVLKRWPFPPRKTHAHNSHTRGYSQPLPCAVLSWNGPESALHSYLCPMCMVLLMTGWIVLQGVKLLGLYLQEV